MMKNKIIAIIMALTLTLPVYSIQEDSVLPTENTVQETVSEEQTLQEEPSQNIENEQFTPETFKQPTSKRKVAKRFLLAMLGVAVSSFLIFAVLSVYNKIRGFVSTPIVNKEEEPSSLETPDNLNDAIKSFLDRTHWDN